MPPSTELVADKGSTRFDRNLKSFMAAIALAAIVIWWL
jgi:hypothetical protein